MCEAERYESIRNGKIGDVVSRTENEVVLDFGDSQRTIKMSNLKRWYKPCSILDKGELDEARQLAEKNAKLVSIVEDPSRPNGDVPKDDCTQLVAKILTYLENKGCMTKKTLSYTRVRTAKNFRNVMELWWGKRIKGVKIVVRSEAIKDIPELFNLGRLYKLTNFFSLDHYSKFNSQSDITQIYALIDKAIEYENNLELKPHPGSGKKGTGLVNGKETLAYKRKLLGVKADNEK